MRSASPCSARRRDPAHQRVDDIALHIHADRLDASRRQRRRDDRPDVAQAHDAHSERCLVLHALEMFGRVAHVGSATMPRTIDQIARSVNLDDR